MKSTWVLALGLCMVAVAPLGAAAPPGAAEDDDDSDVGLRATKVKTSLEVASDDPAVGAVLDVGFALALVPEGTRVHFSFSEALTGKSLASFAAIVSQGRVSRSKVLEQLQPLDYRLKAEVRLGEQRRAVHAFLRREFGLPRGSSATLLTRTFELGSPQARLACVRGELRALLDETSALRARLARQVEVPLPADPSARKALSGALEGDLRATLSVPLKQLEGSALLADLGAVFAPLKRVEAALQRVLNHHLRGQRDRADQKLAAALTDTRLAIAAMPAPEATTPSERVGHAASPSASVSSAARAGAEGDEALRDPALDRVEAPRDWATPLILGLLACLIAARLLSASRTRGVPSKSSEPGEAP